MLLLIYLALAEGFGCGDCGEAFCSFECCDKRKDHKGKKKRKPNKYITYYISIGLLKVNLR